MGGLGCFPLSLDGVGRGPASEREGSGGSEVDVGWRAVWVFSGFLF